MEITSHPPANTVHKKLCIIYVCTYVYNTHLPTHTVLHVFIQHTFAYTYSTACIHTTHICLHIQYCMYSYNTHLPTHTVLHVFIQHTFAYTYSTACIHTTHICLHIQYCMYSYNTHLPTHTVLHVFIQHNNNTLGSGVLACKSSGDAYTVKSHEQGLAEEEVPVISKFPLM